MKPHCLMLTVLVAGLSLTSNVTATEPDPCIGAWAAARPGPVPPSQKAIRLIPNSVVQTAADFSVRLLDASGQEVPVVIETHDFGAYFLRATQELPIGAYQLEYTDACNAAAQNIDLAVLPTQPFPASLGKMTIGYEAYCPGETVDSPWGPITKDFPPPISVYFELAPELQAFGPFMLGQIQDDLGTAYTSKGFLFLRADSHVSCRRSAACSGNSLSVPIGLRTLTMTAELVDGPPIPSASAEIDITCLDCPSKPPVENTSPPVNVPPQAPPPNRARSCHLGQTSAENDPPWLLLLLAAAAISRKCLPRYADSHPTRSP